MATAIGVGLTAAWRSGAPTTDAPRSPRAPFSGADAARLMDDLVASPAAAHYALKTIVAARDSRFIAVLIETMRASQVGALTTIDDGAGTNALERLSGKWFGDDWAAWAEWYGATRLVPPPGFTGWKGRLFGRLDPYFREFLSAGAPSRIRVEEIQWGGVVVDGIPALTHPKSIPAASATYLTLEEPVFGLSINGYARAYPLRILDWHEVVNDRVGGVPISLTYCTLCGSGIAYDARASDGVTYYCFSLNSYQGFSLKRFQLPEGSKPSLQLQQSEGGGDDLNGSLDNDSYPARPRTLDQRDLPPTASLPQSHPPCAPQYPSPSLSAQAGR